MDNRISNGLILGCAALLLVLVACSGGIVAGALGTQVLSRTGLTAPLGVDGPPDEGTAQTFRVFWEAWEIVRREYVDKEALEPTRMTYGAIRGMIDSLGDIGHTRFMSPEERRFQETSIQGSFAGIGAEVAERNGQIVIVAPLEDSPAERAGIRAGDIIIAVDGDPVEGESLTEVISKVRGPKGVDVTLTVLHPDAQDVTDITITRDEIRIDAASWTMLPGNVAYIRMTQFSANLHADLQGALREAREAGAEKYLVDVRNNPGGLVDQVVRVTSEFLPSGTIFIERDAEGNETPYTVTGNATVSDAPLVVLINNGSASAAEIFAGALKDGGRATLVGETTFGTGTVLRTFALSDGSALLLGIAEWLTPDGQLIKGNGVAPDIEVALPTLVAPSSPNQLRGMSEAQILALEDVQLVRGYEELLR